MMIRLNPHDIVAERPFTHPTQVAKDLITLRHMANELSRILEDPRHYTQRNGSITLLQPNPTEWTHRLIITQPEQLLTAAQLTVVGFLSFKRRNADTAVIQEYDKILVAELPQYPDLLSYSTIAHSSGDYSNLVVFARPEGKIYWSSSRAHAEAVYNLSPNYYASVRLYSGVLPNGIMASEQLTVTAVKYFDYQSTPTWDAIRYLTHTGY